MFLVPGAAFAAELHATPSTFASVFSAAQGGDTILLAAGSYGSWSGGSKSSRVTVRPEPGASPSIGVNFGSSVNNITIDGFPALRGDLINGAKNVTISNSVFTGGLAVIGATVNVVLDHNSFDNLGQATWEGRLSLNQGASGVIVSNNHFGGNAGCSDGIFVGDATGTIVTGNEFTGIKQGSCGPHTDSIQLYDGPRTTITGNYFHDNDTIIMAPDGGDHNTITNNVMVGSGYVPAVQLGTHNGTTFVHNTTKNIDVHMDHKSGQPASSNGLVRDNVFVNGGTNALDPGNCTGCTVNNNLFTNSSDASGTNKLIATPTFTGGTNQLIATQILTGGTNPTSLSGWALTPGSPGTGTATDGTDLGAAVGGG